MTLGVVKCVRLYYRPDCQFIEPLLEKIREEVPTAKITTEVGEEGENSTHQAASFPRNLLENSSFFRRLRVLDQREDRFLQAAPWPLSVPGRDDRDHEMGRQGKVIHAHVSGEFSSGVLFPFQINLENPYFSVLIPRAASPTWSSPTGRRLPWPRGSCSCAQ